MSSAVIWHDLECGSYTQDLPLWLALADEHPGAVLDIGAGTGRVSIALAGAGHEVVALDRDQELTGELSRRVGGALSVICADAREFDLGERRFALVIAPMQTVQLLGGDAGRLAFLRRAAAHLAPGGVVAVAIVQSHALEEFEWHDGDDSPLPDIVELDGAVYCSQPTAVRRDGPWFVLERRREAIAAAGARTIEHDRVRLDVVARTDLEQAGQRAGLRIVAVHQVAPTLEHIGSEVVVLGV